jgi:hypothetical protein
VALTFFLERSVAELLLNQFKSVFTKPTNNDLPSTRIQSKNNIKPIIIEKLLTNSFDLTYFQNGFVLLLFSPSMMFVLT